MSSFSPSVYKRQASAPASFARNDFPADSQEGATSNQSPTQRTCCFLASPLTPEGLLPRKSAANLRREWKLSKSINSSREFLPSGRSDWEELLPGVSGILEDMESTTQRSSNNHNRHALFGQGKDGDDSDEDDDNMTIPQPQNLQNKPTFDSSLLSPQVSISSFYSSRAEGQVALSPVLKIGQARTAVGALVALRETGNENLDTNGSSYRDISTNSVTNSKKESNLPQLDQSFAMSSLPPRAKITERCSEREDSDNENIFNLLSTREKCIAAGINNREDLSRLAPPSSVQLQTSHLMPVSTKASVPGEENTALKSTSHPSQVSLNDELSRLGGAKTTVRDQQTQLDLDGDQDARDQALMKRKFANQKVQKQKVKNSIHEKERDGGVVEGRGETDGYCGNDEEEHEMRHIQMDGTIDSIGEALQRRKQQNQRLEKEKIVLEVVARLRDNLDLVHDIEASCSTKSQTENLLVGFSAERRTRLLSSIDSILSEMPVIEAEDFMISPTKAQILSTSHNSLDQALCFCRSLVLNAVPQHEKERIVKKVLCNDKEQQLFAWKGIPELWSTLGRLPPQSPGIIFGGSTSQFSLPGDQTPETPHTSNVSLATSITSGSANALQKLPPRPRPGLTVRHDGLQLRHTVKVVTSLLQNLTLFILQLGEQPRGTQRYVRVCDEIQQQYLQLVAIAKNDYKTLMDKFRLEVASTRTDLVLALKVSDHESEQMVHQYARYRQGHCDQSQRSRENPSKSMQAVLRGKIVAKTVATMFSPPAEDMTSIPGRRLIDRPSNEYNGCGWDACGLGKGKGDDREDQDENCQIAFELREDSEEWRQMYDNISLAASSIRSTANFTTN